MSDIEISDYGLIGNSRSAALVSKYGSIDWCCLPEFHSASIFSSLLDKQNGEWYWGINEDYTIMQHQDKAGFWKCPYHNSRACIELIGRIEKVQ